MSEERTFTKAEVREIVGLLTANEWVSPEIAEKSTSPAVREFLTDVGAGDLRHWGAFAEVVAFTYNPATLELTAVARSTSFLGDPTPNLKRELEEAGWNGKSPMEIWGLRHAWSRASSHGGPECLDSIGRRHSSRNISDIAKSVFDGGEPSPGPVFGR